jgi:hypothetical protein
MMTADQKRNGNENRQPENLEEMRFDEQKLVGISLRANHLKS